MGHMTCSCGTRISDTTVRRLQGVSLLTKALTAHACPDCGRLWVESDLASGAYLPYLPDGHETRDLLTSSSPDGYDPVLERDSVEPDPMTTILCAHELVRAFSLLRLFARHGLTLEESLRLIVDELGAGTMVGRALLEAVEALRTGTPLADSLAGNEELFPDYTVEWVREAEAGLCSLESAAEAVVEEMRFAFFDSPDVARFAYALGAFLEAGLGPSEALERVVDSVVTDDMKDAARAIREGLATGQTLTAELTRRPRLFPQSLVRVVDRAEAGGNLALALQDVALEMRYGHLDA